MIRRQPNRQRQDSLHLQRPDQGFRSDTRPLAITLVTLSLQLRTTVRLSSAALYLKNSASTSRDSLKDLTSNAFNSVEWTSHTTIWISPPAQGAFSKYFCLRRQPASLESCAMKTAIPFRTC